MLYGRGVRSTINIVAMDVTCGCSGIEPDLDALCLVYQTSGIQVPKRDGYIGQHRPVATVPHHVASL